MDWKKVFTPKRIIFILIFFVVVLIGKNINFSAVIGKESQFFTLFQFFGPVAGSFLGPVFGIVAVAFSQLADVFIMGKSWTLINLLRILPMLFAVYYFGSKKKYWGAVVPVICMVLFILHPIGQQVWFFSLFWLIPILGKILPNNLFFRSFGATFTAHAIGSTIWLYTVPMAASTWISLVPVVVYERFVFGLGIAGSYLLFNTVLDYVVEHWKIPSRIISVEKKYSLRRCLKS